MYTYSLDGEDFYGNYESREEALKQNGGTGYTAKTVSATEFIREMSSIGDNIIENVDEWLHDDISFDDFIIDCDTVELNKVVVDWLCQNATFRCSAVREIVRH